MKIVKLSKLPIEKNVHNPKILKKVMIKKEQIPHLTNFSQGYFPPGEYATEHSHQNMYEVFFVEKGNCTIKINGKSYKLGPGSCLTAEPGDLHEVRNSDKEELILTYFGVEVPNEEKS